MLNRKDVIRHRIADLENELARLETVPDGDQMPNGTLVVLVASFMPEGRQYTYVLLKVGNRWFSTGSTGPDKSTWTEVLAWLARNNLAVHRTRIGRVDDLPIVEGIEW